MMISFFKIVMKKSTRHLFYTVSTHSMNSICRDQGAYPPRSFTQVRQQGQLNWASQFQPSGQ